MSSVAGTNRGITLIEILVVLAIMGITATFVLPAFPRILDDRPHGGEATVELLRGARARSVRSASRVTVSINRHTGAYRYEVSSSTDGQDRRDTGEGNLDGVAGSTGRADEDPLAVFVFYPNGAVEPDTVVVMSERGRTTVTVDPVTGAVEVEQASRES